MSWVWGRALPRTQNPTAAAVNRLPVTAGTSARAGSRRWRAKRSNRSPTPVPLPCPLPSSPRVTAAVRPSGLAESAGAAGTLPRPGRAAAAVGQTGGGCCSPGRRLSRDDGDGPFSQDSAGRRYTTSFWACGTVARTGPTVMLRPLPHGAIVVRTVRLSRESGGVTSILGVGGGAGQLNPPPAAPKR